MSDNVVEGIDRLGGTDLWRGDRFVGYTNVEATEGHGGTTWHGHGSVVVSDNVVEGTEGPRGTKWSGG